MEKEWSPEHRQIKDAVEAICAKFGDDYWRQKDQQHEFPIEFRQAIADAGWLGITMPPEYGGAGLGVTEAALLMQTIAGSGGAIAACTAVHNSIFGPHAIVVHGTDEQRATMLPPLISGEHVAAFCVTEPDAGLDTTSITTRADRKSDGSYIMSGRKTWISLAQRAHKMLILARTTPLSEVKKRTDGLSLFYTDVDRRYVETRVIPKMGRAAVDSNTVFIDGLPVPENHRLGQEGQGFRILLDAINPERILVAAECVGIGRRALRKAVNYANERVVFGRPIGQNQSIQHPLARNWMELEAADLMVWRAAELYDARKPCGAHANAAKLLASEAGFEACNRAVRTMGGMGYGAEYDVERYLREIMIPNLAPVSSEMILNFVSEHVLGLPKSY